MNTTITLATAQIITKAWRLSALHATTRGSEGVSKTKISWSQFTWNPVVGCSKVSAGCDGCYAMGDSPHRFASKYDRDGVIVLRGTAKKPGLTWVPRSPEGKSLGKGAQWTGEVRCLPWMLDVPLKRKKPTTYFVNSLSDMFHESLAGSEEGRRFIAAIFGVMAACPQHTFQVLTKRPDKAREWFEWLDAKGSNQWLFCATESLRYVEARFARTTKIADPTGPWPLPNAWIGTSVEDQRAADERIPELLRVPAALRFLSVEPLLGPLDLGEWIGVTDTCGACTNRREFIANDHCDACGSKGCMVTTWGHDQSDAGPPIDWIITGGESGPKARPCEVAWIRSVVEQCKDAGVPVWVKQLGSKPVARSEDDLGEEAVHDWDACTGGHPFPIEGWIPRLRSRAGSDPDEWPEDLRVQELPCTS